MKYAAEMALYGMILVPSFIKIGTGVQAILRFCLRNLRGSNVGIMNGEIYDLCRCDGVRYHNIHTKFHKDRFRHSEINVCGRGEFTYRHAHRHTHAQRGR
jgi:hypothetical protein